MRQRGRTVSSILSLVVVSGLMGAVGTRAAVAAGGPPQPAFYTYQAPGGASTAGERVIALTFDDGPGPYTPQVLSVLQQYHVPATFFEIGEHAAQYPQYTRLLSAAGDPVQDHTWSHPDLSTIAVSQFPYQIDQTQQEIYSLTGIQPTCVRPPYNAWNATVLQQLAQRGLTTMSYSIDPRDWSLPGTAVIVQRVVSAAFPGGVVDLHDSGGPRDQTVAALPQIIQQLKGRGYTFVPICRAGHTARAYSFGSAPAAGPPVTSQAPFVGAATSASSSGYWLVGSDGGVFSFDGAGFFGSTGGVPLRRPVVGMASTADGRGYWLVASDGGVFSFGDARFHGSTGGVRLTEPVVGMASTADGRGYWLVASDGGVFSFGDARFHGSTGGVRLTEPVVGMASTADGGGYWLLASDGGVFSFGDARFHGSTGGLALHAAIVGIAASRAPGGGYWLLGADGGVFAFNAGFYGSGVGSTPPARFFAICPGRTGRGYLLAGQI
jgi:peptidoglycan/xylan/chitin deacetylase (PgdA/CDA1 family)